MDHSGHKQTWMLGASLIQVVMFVEYGASTSYKCISECESQRTQTVKNVWWTVSVSGSESQRTQTRKFNKQFM